MSLWFHGTNESSANSIYSKGVDFSKSSKELDFGAGFYLTDNEQVAIKRAFHKTKIFNSIQKCDEQPAIVTVQINDARLGNLVVKRFDFCNKDWLYFVIANRLSLKRIKDLSIGEHNLDLRYDIVTGSIADSSIAQIANDVETGVIDISSISVYDILTEEGTTLGNQMSLHTKESLSVMNGIAYQLIERRRK